MKHDSFASSRSRPARPPAWLTGLLGLAFLSSQMPQARAQTHVSVNVPTYHNDPARTGQNVNETVLTPSSVHSNTFGLLFTNALDGWVFCQPLYVEGVAIPGKGVHNVVYIATMHDSVYAFDADDNQGTNALPLWHANLINPAAGISTVPMSAFGYNNPPELGITGTPVIDLTTGTIFLVAKTQNTNVYPVYYAQWLYALDIATGAPKFGSPVEIKATYPGNGYGSVGGSLAFDPFWEFQRTGLALVNGVVYLAFASQGDEGPYHGWVIGYDARTLEQVQVFVNTPNAAQGGIWMSGAAPAADEAGNLFLLTGNGDFDAISGSGNVDFGDSFLKLTPGVGRLTVGDFFTPYDQSYLNGVDGDLGSGGVVVLPDEVGSPKHPHLAFGGGKEGILYLVDRDAMGGYNPVDDSQIVQSVSIAGSMFGMPAYFDHALYFSGVTDQLHAYSISNAQVSASPVSTAADLINFPGPTPGISANGLDHAIVWIVQADLFNNTPDGRAILRAYDARNLTVELYSSTDAGARDELGEAQKFAVPTIANGKVYTATAFGLAAFGNLGAPLIAVPPQSQEVAAGTGVNFHVTASGTPPLTYQWYHGNAALTNATNAWFTLGAVQPPDAGAYTVVVGNAISNTMSLPAQLNVNAPPKLGINAQLELTIAGQVGRTYTIQYIPDLTFDAEAWLTLKRVTLTDTNETVIDVDAPDQPQRFYRAILEP